MISILRKVSPGKPHLFFAGGYWRVTRRPQSGLAAIPWKLTDRTAKAWNTYRGEHNRQARLLCAWSKQA